jgi:hypothetical protein
MRLVLVVPALLLLATPALAKDKADKPADPDKKVCRSLEQVGTMFSKRICHTAEEWKAIDGANAKSADGFDDARSKSGATR